MKPTRKKRTVAVWLYHYEGAFVAGVAKYYHRDTAKIQRRRDIKQGRFFCGRIIRVAVPLAGGRKKLTRR